MQGFFSSHAAPACMQFLLQHAKVSSLSPPTGSATQNASASSVSHCLFVTSLRYKEERELKGGSARTNYPAEQKDKRDSKCSKRERERRREGMSNARRLPNRRERAEGRGRERAMRVGVRERVAVNVFK